MLHYGQTYEFTKFLAKPLTFTFFLHFFHNVPQASEGMMFYLVIISLLSQCLYLDTQSVSAIFIVNYLILFTEKGYEQHLSTGIKMGV